MPFMAKATATREEGEEWVLPDEDEYEAVVDRIEEFPTTDFNDRTKQVIHARIVWRITEAGPFQGATADAIFNPSLNEKAKLYKPFKAITGITPDPGKTYDLESELVGKPCRIEIEHRLGSQGGKFANVATVLAPRKKKGRPADDEDDDLRDA